MKELRKILIGSIAVALFVAMAACSTDSSITEPADDGTLVDITGNNLIEGRYIVIFEQLAIAEKGEDIQSFSVHERELRVEKAIERSTSNLDISAARVSTVFSTALQGAVLENLTLDDVNKLRNDRNVKHIVQDRIISLPPLEINRRKPPKGGGGGGGGTPPPAQTVPWGIAQVGGQLPAPSGITAWIIDSGIDYNHPDLNVNPSRGTNYVTKGKNTVKDGNGHGTHVAGTVGALDNDFGVVGVAAGVELVPMRVLDNRGNGYFSWSVKAFDDIAIRGSAGDVVNFSVGSSSRYTDIVIDNAVKGVGAKGIMVCLSAGNENDNTMYYSPARLDAQNVYTIGSMTQSISRSSFSNYGTSVDYYEPGSGVYSTYKDGGYATLSGTSMASPHACGILALGNGITAGAGSVSGVPIGTDQWGKR